MIAKRIDRKTNDSFKRLAEYIAAAKDKGEKLDRFWMVNCNAGSGLEDLDVGIIEVEATQALNRRAKADRTYHLIVSFRDEKPAPEALVEIERAFAEALGYGEHQRMIATHQNTGNFHMHLAINKVHPVTLRNVTPKRDFQILEKTCRELEKRFGLKIDLGREDKPEKDRVNWRAKDYEAHTWQESLQTYVTREKADLAKVLTEAKSWKEVHLAMAERGLVLKPRGAGMVIATIEGDQAVKASSLGREWSAANLKKRLGPYRSPEKTQDGATARERAWVGQTAQSGASGRSGGRKAYTRRPSISHPAVPRLWRRYEKARRSGLLGIAARSFKQWLLMGAIDDPLAIALLVHQRAIGGVAVDCASRALGQGPSVR